MTEKTLFQKIGDGDIPAEKVHEDETCFAIRDINPQAPDHILIIPRRMIPRMEEATNEDATILGHLLLTARDLAKTLNFKRGYRIVINNGEHGGESVPHLHVHLLAGRQLHWPPG